MVKYSTNVRNKVAKLIRHMTSAPAGTFYSVEQAAQVMECNPRRVQYWLSHPVKAGVLVQESRTWNVAYRLCEGLQLRENASFLFVTGGPEPDEDSLEEDFERPMCRRWTNASDTPLPKGLGPISVFHLAKGVQA